MYVFRMIWSEIWVHGKGWQQCWLPVKADGGTQSTGMNIYRKDWCWSSHTLAPDVKSQLTGKDQCWETLRVGREGSNRGWDGWMASSTNGHKFEETLGDNEGWGSVLQSMGSQSIGHYWATEQHQSRFFLKSRFLRSSLILLRLDEKTFNAI